MLDESTANERLKRSFPAMKASFANYRSLRLATMEAMVGELTITGSDGDGGMSSETCAGAFAEAEGVRFPAFSLQPQSGCSS